MSEELGKTPFIKRPRHPWQPDSQHGAQIVYPRLPLRQRRPRIASDGYHKVGIRVNAPDGEHSVESSTDVNQEPVVELLTTDRDARLLTEEPCHDPR